MNALAMVGGSLLTDAVTKFFDRPKKLRNQARQTKINKLSSNMQTENLANPIGNATVQLNNKVREDKIRTLESQME